MCRKLGVPRSLVYYKKRTRKINSELENAVIEIFKKSRNNYGSRKIKIELAWCYICILIDLFNREIIGYSAGAHKNAQLVYDAFLSSKVNLSKVKIFHTDRGNEFKNKIIDDLIYAFKITRSLSHKGCPYDNAVAEATYKIFKTEFVINKTFDSLDQLQSELADYVHWFNHFRIHGSLGYLSPVQFKSFHPAK